MKVFKKLLVALVVSGGLLSVVGSVSPCHAVEPNAVQSRSQRDIVASAARMTKLAYVTSKSHTKIDYVKGVVYKDGAYDLTYQYTYRDNDGDTQTFTLRYEFNETGKLLDVKTLQHSSFWEPFNALKLAGAFLEGVANEMNRR